jgi:Ca2+-binding RTX toxin-like protein
VNGQQEYAGLWSALTSITIAATAGNDTINLEDTPTGVPVTINLGDGSDTVNLNPTAQKLSTLAGTITINGGSGNDTLVGPGANNTWRITSSNTGTLSSANMAGLVTFGSVQNLSGGTANNTFVFSDGAGISGNLDGGTGGGSLDYSAYSTSVIVDLQTATATGVGGRISHIQNITGGDSGGLGIYNLLVGTGGNTLIGGTARRNLLIAGSSASTLIGGADDDILVGGTTAYDADVPLLMAIMDYWSGTSDDYATRVGNLLSGNGVPLLDATTVISNGGGNTLLGGPGLNLYYGNAGDITDCDPSSGAVFILV